MSTLLIATYATSSLLLINHKYRKELPDRNNPLTIIIDFRGQEEVTVHRLGHCSQGIAGLQGVVAVVEVCRVPEAEAALQIVLIEIHVCFDVLILDDLLLLVEPTQLGVGVAAHRELDAGIVALLGLGQRQDDWRIWGENRRFTRKNTFQAHK